MPVEGCTTSSRKRKKRLAVACLSCRVRKERCDRIIPGCNNCKRRSVLCRWGDERDNHSKPRHSNCYNDVEVNHTSHSSRGSPNAIHITPEKGMEDIERLAHKSPFAPTTSTIDANKQFDLHIDQIVERLPSRDQARHLTTMFLDLGEHIYHTIDTDEFLTSMDAIYDAMQSNRSPNGIGSLPLSTSSLSSRRGFLGELTRLLFVLAASATQVSPLYHQVLGTVATDGSIIPLCAIWLEKGLECFDICHRTGQITLQALQASVIFLLWLSDRTDGYRFDSILDAGIRAASMLGLDRLASADLDRKFISDQDAVPPQMGAQSLTWGAETLFRSELDKREQGRAVWHALCLLNQTGCSQSIRDKVDELSTAFPGNSDHDDDCYDAYQCWQIMKGLLPIMQDFKYQRDRAEATGRGPNLESVKSVYRRLREFGENVAPICALDDILKLQYSNGHSRGSDVAKKGAQRAWFALLVQLKVLIVHRPLIGAAYRQEETHRNFIAIAVQSAHTILDGAQRFQAVSWPHFHSTFGKMALLQAALVLLLELYHHPQSLDTTEGQLTFRHLRTAIEHLRAQDDYRHPNNALYRMGAKLESLLVAGGRHSCLQANTANETLSLSPWQLETLLAETDILPNLSWLDSLALDLQIPTDEALLATPVTTCA